ncbi:autotransporter outer membrane beta-barrel domain-containing protein [Bartonella mastomydis]|uniref:autotransporter outer membrane beta-barrel domain-containing protein n=1 Tax=Bartonella mastomydis TaxID=1820002 RepID=UPI001AEDBE0F|nr:autotransporter outer membrane beta-barrel domain-containing protein [Bartonella mastomydis]
MLKNHLSLCRFTTVIFFFVYNADAGDVSSQKKQYSCNESASFYHCNDGKTHEISGKTYQLTGESSEAALEASGENTLIEGKAIIINGVSNANGPSGKGVWTTGVKASKGGGVALFDSMLNDVSIGADIDEDGVFDMQNGVIKATRMGISVSSEQSLVSLTKTEIITPADAIGLLSHNGAKIYMKGGKIDFTEGIGVQTGGEGEIDLEGVSIIGKGKQATSTDNPREGSAFSMLQGKGMIHFQKGNVNVHNVHGLVLQGNNNAVADIKHSNIFVRGKAFHGMHFFWEAVLNDKKTIIPGKGSVQLTQTTFIAPESTAIYSREFESSVKLLQNSKVSGDSLLKAVEHSNIKIEADASTLQGSAYVDESSTAEIVLKNGSKWILSRPKVGQLQNSDASSSRLKDYSSISSIELTNSSLIFEKLKSKTTDGYQTLLIGKGSGTVYKAQGNANLYLNTYLDKGGKLEEQKTDRLLINGGLEGKTIVHVYKVLGSPGALTGEGGNDQGISIIQVYGQAAEDSFQLKGGYVTLDASPYQYRLKSYGPSSTLGEADSNQRVLKNTGTFWDFRLESKMVDSSSLDPTEIFPVLDAVVPPVSDEVPAFPKNHPHMTGGEEEVIDPNSQQKPQEPSLSSPVDFPDRDPHLKTVSDVFDVFMLDVPNPPPVSSPPSLTPVRPSTPKSHPVVPTSGSPVSPSVPSTPSVVSSASGSPVLPSVARTPSTVSPPASSSPVSPSVARTPSVVSSASGSPVLPSVARTPSTVSPPASSSPVSPSVTRTPSVVSSASGSPVSPSVARTPSTVSPPASSSPVSPSVTRTPSVVSSASGSPVSPSVVRTPSVVSPSASSSSVSSSVPSTSSVVVSPKSSSSVTPPVFELSSHFEPNVRTIVPQVLTYILVPNTLFHAGLVDISHQNKQLQTLRTFSRRLLKTNENPALFLRGYGGHHRYTSNLSALEYGYGGDLDYNALEAGILLKKIESAYSTTSFGIMGNYGKLSLLPREVKQRQESIFDKWTITAYGSMQHDTGFYMDGLFSYGLFNGNVLTRERGKTAVLRGKPLSFSLTAGKTFMIGCRCFIFEPQVQFVYQNLQFHNTRDIDNLNIDMRRPDHWGMRIGGHLTKTLTLTKDAQVLSFYGTLHFVRNFDDKQFVYFKDAFQLGSFGSSLEAGFGVYSQLSPQITFHSDLIYKHKFTKAGFSGTHFSGGLSYHF